MYRPLSKLRITCHGSRDKTSPLAKHLMPRVQYGPSSFYFKPSGVCLKRSRSCLKLMNYSYCAKRQVKRSGRKAELIRRLLTNWQLELDFTSITCEGNSDPCAGSASKSLSSGKSLVDVHKIQSWTKSLASSPDFTFVHLYHYLVNSKEKTFDEEGMKAYKSLKVYKYFADGYSARHHKWPKNLHQR